MQKHTNKRKVFTLNKLGIKRCKSFGYYNYNKVESQLEIHYHKNILEICFCLKGQQFYEVNGVLIKMNGNDILIIPPNTKHSSGIYPEDIGELYWLQISTDESKYRLCNLLRAQSEYLINSLIATSSLIIKGSYALKPLLDQLKLELNKDQTILGNIKKEQVIIQLMLEVLRHSQKPSSIMKTNKHRIIDTFIHENSYRSIYVDELAKLLNISTSYFKSWFKKTAGMPPKEYINRIKIELAKKKLLKEEKITKVAFDLGFNSSQYFATSFKKYVGQTPKEFSRLKNINF